MTVRPTANNRVDALLNEIKGDLLALKPSQLLEDVKNVPMELAAAFTTGRPELLKLVTARQLSAEECEAVYNLLAALIRTNFALQRHAHQTAELVKAWMSGLQTMQTGARRIEHFANFRSTIDDEEGTE